MNYFLLFLAEIVLLLILSKKTSGEIYSFINKITRNNKISLWFYAILFLPGTFLHELAHWATAKLLFVKTTSFNIYPQIEGNTMKLGSVMLYKSDPFRTSIVGIAPLFVGLSAIIAVIRLFQFYELTRGWLGIILQGYLFLTIGSTMLLSKSDVKEVKKIIIVLSAIFLILYILGLKLDLANSIVNLINNYEDIWKESVSIMLLPLAFFVVLAVILSF
jgi:hypothetical protein